MALVTGTFRSVEAAKKAMEDLNLAGLAKQAWIEEERLVDEKPGDFPDNFDPIGGARLAGRSMTFPPGTGGNLIGNSVTIDVTLSELPEILEAVAEDREESRGAQVAGRLVLHVEAGDRTQEVAALLRRHRARDVRIGKNRY